MKRSDLMATIVAELSSSDGVSSSPDSQEAFANELVDRLDDEFGIIDEEDDEEDEEEL